MVVGTDGAGSSVAKVLGLPPPTYSGYCAYRGVAQLGEGGLQSIGLPGDLIRQMWAEGTRAGIYPMTDSEVYW
jgi:hypothetical protein